MRLALRVGPPLFIGYLRFVYMTSRKRFVGLDKVWRIVDAGGNLLAAVWHNDFPMAVCGYGRRGVAVLVSMSRDGELIARALERAGFTTVRGSSSRGGREAMDKMASQLDKHRGLVVAITVDGPRGPRHVVKPGIVAMSRRTGYPIVVTSCIAKRNIVFNSWDRTVLPLPFNRLVFVVPELLSVPSTCDRAEFETYLEKVTQLLIDAERTARDVLARKWRRGDRFEKDTVAGQ